LLRLRDSTGTGVCGPRRRASEYCNKRGADSSGIAPGANYRKPATPAWLRRYRLAIRRRCTRTGLHRRGSLWGKAILRATGPW